MIADELKHKRAAFDEIFTWLQMSVEVKKEWTVLEFGTGRAGFARFYGEYVARVIALDIHDFSSLHPGVEFVVSDGRTISLPDESVDLVVSHSVLEHVNDLVQSVTEINRVLKLGGIAYLTVSPLYFSATGSHVNEPELLRNWEHLNPASKYYLLENPLGKTGAYLNKLTSARMLWALGHTSLDILRYEIRTERKAAPDWLTEAEVPLIDIFTREFRLVAHKKTRIKAGGAVQVAPYPYLRGLAVVA